MQESRRSAVGRSLPTSIFDKFQGIYNQQDSQLRHNYNMNKRLLAKIMEKEQQQNYLRKSAAKQVENYENKEMDLFWKNQEERLRARERKRRQDIQEARKVNNASFNEIQSKSMNVDSYHLQKNFRDDLAAFQEHERQKKDFQRQFYQESMMAQEARQNKKRYDREVEVLTERKKEEEDRELNARRGQFFTNWRNKHFQDKHTDVSRLYGDIHNQREIQKAMLQEAIAVKGGHQLNQRVAALRAAEIQQKAKTKEDHLKQLKHQTEENTYKAAIDKYLQLNYQKKRMEQMSRALDERDHKEKQYKKQSNNQHLSVLRGQMKPRVLLQETDKIEAAGIGSPVHIGKIVHDDRIRQLKWIQRSFLQQLNQG